VIVTPYSLSMQLGRMTDAPGAATYLTAQPLFASAETRPAHL
jgi:hypothetical protein